MKRKMVMLPPKKIKGNILLKTQKPTKYTVSRLTDNSDLYKCNPFYVNLSSWQNLKDQSPAMWKSYIIDSVNDDSNNQDKLSWRLLGQYKQNPLQCSNPLTISPLETYNQEISNFTKE